MVRQVDSQPFISLFRWCRLADKTEQKEGAGKRLGELNTTLVSTAPVCSKKNPKIQSIFERGLLGMSHQKKNVFKAALIIPSPFCVWDNSIHVDVVIWLDCARPRPPQNLTDLWLPLSPTTHTFLPSLTLFHQPPCSYLHSHPWAFVPAIPPRPPSRVLCSLGFSLTPVPHPQFLLPAVVSYKAHTTFWHTIKFLFHVLITSPTGI